MSTQRKQSALSIKDKQTSISRLEKGEKRTNLSLEFKMNKQQILYIHVSKNEEKKDSEIHPQRRDEGLKIHKCLQSVHKFKKELIHNYILFSLIPMFTLLSH